MERERKRGIKVGIDSNSDRDRKGETNGNIIASDLIATTSTTSTSTKIISAKKIVPESSLGTVFLNIIFLVSSAGMFLSALILLFGTPFIRQIFQINGVFLSSTVEYFKIRGLSLPAVLLNYIVFGFSIAMQDIKAPVYSIITAFLVNVIGDYVLVGRLNYGLQGAAVATAVSSYLGAFVALRHIFKRYNIKIPRKIAANNDQNEGCKKGENNHIDGIVNNNIAGGGELSSSGTSTDKKINNKKGTMVGSERTDVEVLTKGKGAIAWGELFNKKGLNMFFSASGPLLLGAIVNTLTYSAGAKISSYTVDPLRATVEIAAHQIVMQSWWFLSYFSWPFSLVAQAVIPKDLIKNNKKRVKKMIKLLLQLAAITGVLVTLCNFLLIKKFPGTFTKNIEIQKIFQTVLGSSSLSIFVICLSTVSDGIFIGCGKIKNYLSASVFSTLAAWIYYTYSIKQKLGIVGAWNGLLIFSLVRMGYYLTAYPNLWSFIEKNKNKSNLENAM